MAAEGQGTAGGQDAGGRAWGLFWKPLFAAMCAVMFLAATVRVFVPVGESDELTTLREERHAARLDAIANRALVDAVTADNKARSVLFDDCLKLATKVAGENALLREENRHLRGTLDAAEKTNANLRVQLDAHRRGVVPAVVPPPFADVQPEDMIPPQAIPIPVRPEFPN